MNLSHATLEPLESLWAIVYIQVSLYGVWRKNMTTEKVYPNPSYIKATNTDQYRTYEQLLRRNGDYNYNAREGTAYLGHRDIDYPSKLHQKCNHLRRFASKPYHQQVNRSCGVKFPDKDTLRGYIDGIVKVEPSEIFRGRPTAQFKTVWASRGMRRSK